jgi:hypothetical protein
LSEARQNLKMRGSTLFKILSSAAQSQLLWPAESTPVKFPEFPPVLFTPAQINMAPLCFAGTKSLPLWCFNYSLLAVHCYYAYDLLEPKHNGTCTVYPSLDGSDDVPAIIDAFRFCGKNGTINFLNETYSIQSVMNTTGLENCVIDLRGTLLVRSFVLHSKCSLANQCSGVPTSTTGSQILCPWDIKTSQRHGFWEDTILLSKAMDTAR